jgi:6-pyruvoyltetrahydropterin/6-carboxytetrahydropterin synthase
MYTIRVEGHFSSAHSLRHYRGRCEELHGHNWIVEAGVRKKELDKTGMVMDFHDLKSALHDVLDKLDHKYLNNLPEFEIRNPTSELLASFIYQELKPKVPGLTYVTVWENKGNSATYEE